MSDLHVQATVNVNIGAIVDGRLTVNFECVGDATRNINFDLTTAQWKGIAQHILRRVLIDEERRS